MHGQAQHLAADGREVGIEQGPEHREQALGTHNGLRIRFVQPVKRRRFPNAERVQQQHDLGEIAALNLRRVALVAILVADHGPQAMTGARSGASGAAFALIRTGAADGLQQQRADAALHIVTSHAGDATVHDMSDAVDGDAGLRDVGGDDHFAQCIRRKGTVLIPRFQFAMQRDARHALPRSQATQRVQGAVDLATPRHEDEDVAGCLFVDDALDRLRCLRGDRALVRNGEVVDLHRIALPFGDEDRALIQIRRHRLGIERGGHHHHRQIASLRLLQVLHQREGDIAEQVSLVELIEHHRPDLGQRAVILKPAQQDAFGDKADAGADTGVIVEADLIANLRAQFALSLRGDTVGHRSGGDAAGLQDHDHLVARNPRIEQHLRHLRRLPRASRCHQHQTIAGLQRAQDVGVNFPNGERGGGRHEERRLS